MPKLRKNEKMHMQQWSCFYVTITPIPAQPERSQNFVLTLLTREIVGLAGGLGAGGDVE